MSKLRITAMAVSAAVFIIVTALVTNGLCDAFEKAVFDALYAIRTPALTVLAKAVTYLGSVIGVIIAAAALIVIPSTRNRIGLPSGISALASAVTNTALKLAIAKPRPDVSRLVSASGYSFPSGHAMNNAAFYTVIALSLFRQAKKPAAKAFIAAGFIIIVLLIGISRVYLGVHTFFDVLAGWTLGVCIGLAADTMANTKQTGGV